MFHRRCSTTRWVGIVSTLLAVVLTTAATDASLPMIMDDNDGDLRTETMAGCVLISDAMNAALGVSASNVTCLAGFNGGKFLYSCSDESVKRLNELGVAGIADGVYSAWSPLSCNGNYYNGDFTAAKTLRAFLVQNECAQHKRATK